MKHRLKACWAEGEEIFAALCSGNPNFEHHSPKQSVLMRDGYHHAKFNDFFNIHEPVSGGPENDFIFRLNFFGPLTTKTGANSLYMNTICITYDSFYELRDIFYRKFLPTIDRWSTLAEEFSHQIEDTKDKTNLRFSTQGSLYFVPFDENRIKLNHYVNRRSNVLDTLILPDEQDKLRDFLIAVSRNEALFVGRIGKFVNDHSSYGTPKGIVFSRFPRDVCEFAFPYVHQRPSTFEYTF